MTREQRRKVREARVLARECSYFCRGHVRNALGASSEKDAALYWAASLGWLLAALVHRQNARDAKAAALSGA